MASRALVFTVLRRAPVTDLSLRRTEKVVLSLVRKQLLVGPTSCGDCDCQPGHQGPLPPTLDLLAEDRRG